MKRERHSGPRETRDGEPELPQSKASSRPGTGLSARETVLLELLKARMGEVTSWVGQMLQASAIFAILSAGLYKFALDANSTPSLRIALSIMGILVSLAGFLACGMMEKLRRRNWSDQAALLGELSQTPLPVGPNRADVIKYALISALIGVVINLGAWLFILFSTQPPQF